MKLSKYLLFLSVSVAMAVSCKKSDFVKANINPSTLASVDPGAQFEYAAIHFPNDFEHFYDYYKAIMPWMQYLTSAGGNQPNFTLESGNFDYRYGNFYGNVGLALSDIPHLVAKMSADQQAGRVFEVAIAQIAKAYYTFYVSDINGDIPYSEAFLGRYGGTLTPKYDTQQEIFDSLDVQIKAAVKTLESTPAASQVLYGGNDPFWYGNSKYAAGEVMGWIKAGNALRLKIASRLQKVDPATLKTIVADVLSDANQMSDYTDSWMLAVGPSYADANGNYNPTGLLSSKPVIDFMNTTDDPRISVFYRPNSNGAYVGSPTDPDTCQLPFYQNLYKASDTPFSPIQHRLWTPNYNEGDGFGAGTGNGFFPFLTYAEYCFLRADFGARGFSSDDPGAWYAKGVTASIQFYDFLGTQAQLTSYTALGNNAGTAAAAYLLKPGVTFSAAKATEQIACQAYIDCFKQPSEGWAWWKRTGFPNTTSVLGWSPLTASSAPLAVPRRAALSVLTSADNNYANQQAALTHMATSSYWGSGPTDASGRVWWDMP